MTQELRIVSLIASATEIVCALGLRSALVGRSHECDYPSDVLKLPQCTSPKFPTNGSSSEIDRRVKTVLEQSLSVYKVDAALLDSLNPTHIITQDQCEVCAVSLKDVEEAACELIRSQPAIVSLKPDALPDVWRDIETVGQALGVQENARQLVNDLQGRLERLRVGQAGKNKPTVAFIEWIDPLMAGGNWMPTLIEAAGGTDAFGVEGKHAPPIEWNKFCQTDPDYIIVAPCGFDIERTEGEMKSLQQREGWDELQAVRDRKVFISDGNQFFNRPGPRLIDSAEIVAAILKGADDARFTRV